MNPVIGLNVKMHRDRGNSRGGGGGGGGAGVVVRKEGTVRGGRQERLPAFEYPFEPLALTAATL